MLRRLSAFELGIFMPHQHASPATVRRNRQAINQGQTTKTSVMGVRDMLSVLSVAGIEDRIGAVPGVESVPVNFAAGNATVRFDETRLNVAAIKSDVRQRGAHTDTQPKAPTTEKAAVAKLRERKIELVMLTGDSLTTATRIGADLGIDKVLADILPGQKAEKVTALQATGRRVGMVGDSVNDAPALTQANVGFAIGAGTDAAMDSADVVLMKTYPYDVVGAIKLSRAAVRKMHQNLWWAVGYNTIALPPAAGA